MLPAQVFAAADPVTVTVFTTNDIHGTVAGEGIVGMAQAAAMKASTPNALLIDAGDAAQGADSGVKGRRRHNNNHQSLRR